MVGPHTYLERYSREIGAKRGGNVEKIKLLKNSVSRPPAGGVSKIKPR